MIDVRTSESWQVQLLPTEREQDDYSVYVGYIAECNIVNDVVEDYTCLAVGIDNVDGS
jgi:hypothetical protein